MYWMLGFKVDMNSTWVLWTRWAFENARTTSSFEGMGNKLWSGLVKFFRGCGLWALALIHDTLPLKC